MKWFEIFSLVIFTLTYCGFAFGENSLLEACNTDDLPCFNLSTKIFLNATSKAIPQYNMLGIDPISIPNIEVRPEDSNIDLVFTMTDIILTGLKDEDVTGFNFDRKTFNARLQVHAPYLVIKGNMKIALASNRSCSKVGKFLGTGAVLLTVSYHSPIEKFPDGTEHFVVGPETSECQYSGQPKYEIDNELVQQIDKVKELREEKLKFTKSPIFLKDVLCDIAKKAYVSVIHNTRTAAKVLPKQAFMKDI